MDFQTTNHLQSKMNEMKTNDRDDRDVLRKITTKGLSGLSNLGNTCYMNSALQALSNTNTLLAYLIHSESPVKNHLLNRALDLFVEVEEKKNKNSVEQMDVDMEMIELNAQNTVTRELRLLFKYMWSENCEVRPSRFKKMVGRKMSIFQGYQQQDSQEFLTVLLDTIHEETRGKAHVQMNLSEEEQQLYDTLDTIYQNKKNCPRENKDLMRMLNRNILNIQIDHPDMYLRVESLRSWKEIVERSYSTINDIFSALIITTIYCTECTNQIYSFERSDLMTLCFPQKWMSTTITLEQLLKNSIESESLIGTNQYNCHYCEQKRDVLKNTLIYKFPDKLVILIKKYQNIGRSIYKDNTQVIYPHELDMTPYIHQSALKYDSRPPTYELYATIRHSGGYGGGHYYAFAKNPINKLWFCYDDSDVYGMTDDEVLQSNSYVLFYQLKT